jgi:Bacterial Ig domain/Calcineurin-like phosphoesterase/Calx-beta domain
MALPVEALESRILLTVTFGVIGDYGTDSAQELAVANLVKSWNPDFVITTGDNGYNTTAADIDRFIGKYYQQFIGNYQGTFGPGAGAVNEFFPSAGNHDWDGGGNTLTPYTNYFTLPGNERYYDYVQGDVHFFVVSSDSREPGGVTPTSVQGQWLQAGLAASTAPWQVVYMHHPPYSSGATHGSTATMQWPYQQWGADAVLAGHDHTYERIIRNDANNTSFPYFVNGTGGNATLYQFTTPVAGSQVRYNGNWGAQRVTATDTSMTFEFITIAGVVVDTYTITNLPSVSISATDANASEPGVNTGTYTISRTGPTTNPLTVSYGWSGTAGNGTDYVTLSGSIVIPANAASVVLSLTPLDDAIVEPTETAILTLVANPAYIVGSSGSATVTIADDDAQTVSITATDSSASEPGANTGLYTVTRVGPTTAPLTVSYAIGGTAANGVDYVALSGTVTIPVGASTATIPLVPLDDAILEGNETVTLTLSSNAAYFIGSPGSAIVTISDDENAPPTISITSPANNASFAVGSTITINANAADSDGSVTQVRFFQGTTLLGTDTSSPYSFAWAGAAIGSYTLTAQVVDNRNAVTTSAPVNITVTAVPRPLIDYEVDSVFDAKNNKTYSATSPDGRFPMDSLNTTAQENLIWIEPGTGSYYEMRFEDAGTGSGNPLRVQVALQYRPELSWAGTLRAEYWNGSTMLASVNLPAASNTLGTFNWDISSVVTNLATFNGGRVRVINNTTNGKKVALSHVVQRADIAQPILNLNVTSVYDAKNNKTYSPTSPDGRDPLNDINSIAEEKKVEIESGAGNYWEANYEDVPAGIGNPTRVIATLQYRPESSWTGTFRAEYWSGSTLLASVNLPATSNTLTTFGWDVSAAVTTLANLNNGRVRLVNISTNGKKVTASYTVVQATFAEGAQSAAVAAASASSVQVTQASKSDPLNQGTAVTTNSTSETTLAGLIDQSQLRTIRSLSLLQGVPDSIIQAFLNSLNDTRRRPANQILSTEALDLLFANFSQGLDRNGSLNG